MGEDEGKIQSKRALETLGIGVIYAQSPEAKGKIEKQFDYFQRRLPFLCKGNYNWLMWVFISRDIVLFVLHPNRSAKIPLKSLFDIEPEETKIIKGPIVNPKKKKIMNVDEFSSYKMLNGLGLAELVFCSRSTRGENSLI